MTKFNLNKHESHLKAIGRVTVNFSVLEMTISSFICTLIGKEPKLGQIITAELSFNNLLQLLSSLYQFRINDPIQIRDLKELLKRASDVEQKRNVIIHSIWGQCDTPEEMIRMKTTAKRGKGFYCQYEKVNFKDLEAIADTIATIACDMFSFHLKTLQVLGIEIPLPPPRPQKASHFNTGLAARS